MKNNSIGLEFLGVSHSYDKAKVLHDVSLAVPSGSITCLLGPSGCGKTTLLRLSAGLEPLQTGEVFLDGGKVADAHGSLAPERRGVGLMFQEYMLFPHLSVMGNVRFGLNELPPTEQIARAKIALEQVGMADFSQHFPHMLSGGEQQRVALARAIVPRPRVLLLDEPFSGLDLRLRKSLRGQTLGLLRELGTTTLMVTHDPEEALLMADHIAVMRNGEVLQEGTGSELYAKPANAFCATFLGEALEHKVYVSSPVVDTPFGAVEVDAEFIGSEVRILIRPEGIIFDTNYNQIEVNSQFVGGRLTDLRAIGAYRQVSLKLHNSGLEVRFLSSRAMFPEVGSDVGIGVDPSMVFVFPVGAG